MAAQNENKVFISNFSAREQEEIKKIRQKYLPKDSSKIDQLRKLDQSVTKKGTMISLFVGIVGSLIFGLGMCCTMVWSGKWFVPGIIVGAVGLAALSIAYPLHQKISRLEREKIAPEIMRLAEDLIGQHN